jgi:hypothetical protein
MTQVLMNDISPQGDFRFHDDGLRSLSNVNLTCVSELNPVQPGVSGGCITGF